VKFWTEEKESERESERRKKKRKEKRNIAIRANSQRLTKLEPCCCVSRPTGPKFDHRLFPWAKEKGRKKKKEMI